MLCPFKSGSSDFPSSIKKTSKRRDFIQIWITLDRPGENRLGRTLTVLHDLRDLLTSLKDLGGCSTAMLISCMYARRRCSCVRTDLLDGREKGEQELLLPWITSADDVKMFNPHERPFSSMTCR
jgi:hypothetical protein